MSIAEQQNEEEVRCLRLPEVKRITGLSKSTLYELIRSKSFPSPVRIGPRTVAWVKSEVIGWATERIQASRLADAPTIIKRMPQRALTDSWQAPKKSA
jgi:prophage regulatory protein